VVLWKQVIWLAAAGGAGTVARWLLSEAVHRAGAGPWPWGTLVVNAAGCLAFGVLWGVFETRAHLSPQLRLVLLTGFFGAFTTFSTFAFESGHLARQAQWAGALLNVAAHNLLGLALAAAGYALGRLL